MSQELYDLSLNLPKLQVSLDQSICWCLYLCVCVCVCLCVTIGGAQELNEAEHLKTLFLYPDQFLS